MSNPFRPTYRELKKNEVDQVEATKDAALRLLNTFPVGSREASIATTKLEEAVMWAVKGITS